MAKNASFDYDTSYTQNRELSWLRFNRRVLEEAADERVPLLERLKFISIFTSNLDEFFMVRVGSLFDLSILSPKQRDNKTGETPRQQLEAIYAAVPGLIEMKDALFAGVTAALAEQGVCDLSAQPLSSEDKKAVSQYFRGFIAPILSQQIIDAHHPFPHLDNKALYVAAHLKDKKGRDALGLVPIPESLPPFFTLPANGKSTRYIRTEHIVLQHAAKLFLPYQLVEACVLCVTRNADIRFDDEKFEDSDVDYRNRVSKLLKKRGNLTIVRLELSRRIGEDFLSLLKARVGVDQKQIYFDSAPLCMGYVYSLCSKIDKLVAAPLSFPPHQPRQSEDIDPERSMIEQIRARDRLLSFPYDSIDPFLRLLNEAAQRDDVVSIKITIYRLASTSKIAQILCRAAENGKEVTALMELRARFDEANNISWSQMLEDAGCRVIYGIDNYKCHSKICLITKKNGEKIEYITQIGTGNYNEKTSTLYTDLSLMTADEAIGRDASLFFRNMLLGNLENVYENLLIAPHGLKPALISLIDREIQKGSDGFIVFKANSLTEREIIDKFCEASQAGVRVELILRGICCLLPGIPGKTDNIHVTSVVGRFLEHSRIYRFGRGDDLRVFISSADLMTRNLNRRVEIACPVTDPLLVEKILRILDVMLRDNVKASTLLSDGTYLRKPCDGSALDSQAYFLEHSLHDESERTAPPRERFGWFKKLFAKK